MSKKLINLYDLEPGMKVAETILNDYGSIIISEGTILDDHLIKKIQKHNLYKINIIEDVKLSSNEINQSFQNSYNEDIEYTKEILHSLSENKGIDDKKVKKVVESVIKMSNEKRDIVRCIKQIKNVDEYTYTHCINVSLLSMLIGKWLKYSSEKIQTLVQAALLHDIGKIKVPLEILNKPGKLTNYEYEEIKKHAVYGYRMIEKESGISKDVCLAVLMHHEREDGSGYPTGAKGDKIHEFAKIISVADIFDAMTSNRVYRERESPFEVFEMMEEKTLGELDVKAVSAFLNNIASYYIGDYVKLNSGDTGEIIYINQRHVSKPIVKVSDKYIDLTVNKDLKIVEII
ncbi:UNVERIFIED_CONTAM: putative nucleotidyltransferase with HDIG domain [Acetivibrio alkalicellulosi]